MANLTQPNLDDLARQMGESLDMVQYAIMAARNADTEFDRKPNFSKALVDAVIVMGVSDYILEVLQPSDIDNRNRFSSLRSDAINLVKRFWANFQLTNIHRLANGSTVEVKTHQNESLAGSPSKAKAAKRGRGHRLPVDVVREIKAVIRSQYKGRLNQKDMQALADKFDVNLRSVSNIFYGTSYQDVE